MDAKGLACPNCGAPASIDLVRCAFCGAQLQTVACPSCFGLMFLGCKFCSHCGARAAAPVAKREAGGCPRCKKKMATNEIGGCALDQCGSCGGIWLDSDTFHEICDSREKQAAFVGPGLPGAQAVAQDPTSHEVVYLPCPRCGDLMNRFNFAGRSGVILNICKSHGTWLDKDELRAVIEFIRAGGLELARKDEIANLEEQKKRIQNDLAAAAMATAESRYHVQNADATTAGRLLRFLLDR